MPVYLYVPVCTGMNRYVLVCPCMYLYILLDCTGSMYWYEHVHTLRVSMYQYILVWTGIIIISSMYQSFTLISNTVMPCYPASGYITVHGSTRKYPEVMYP